MKALGRLITIGFFLLTSFSAKAEGVQEVSVLKKQILAMARAEQGKSDADGARQKEFLAMAKQLASMVPARTQAEFAQNAVGPWHQIWGPTSFKGSGPVSLKLDPAMIYQVIAADGTYTNVGVYHLAGHEVVGLLKGAYKVEADQISLQFTKSSFLAQKVPAGKSLSDLPKMADQGQLRLLTFPSFVPPVGIRGALHEVYSDADLRITEGTQGGQAGRTLFILERTKSIQ